MGGGGGGDGGDFGRVALAAATLGVSEIVRDDTSKKEKALALVPGGAGIYQTGKQGLKEMNKGQVKARKEAMAETERFKSEMDALRSEAEAKAAGAESDVAAAGQKAQSRQKRRIQAAQGRSDTILTGPLGLTGSAPKSGKTLLGS